VGKFLLDRKPNSCCSLEWYEQENEVVWCACSSARACATLCFSSHVLRWQRAEDLSMIPPDTITELQGQCCSRLNNVSHQWWECLEEYKYILLSFNHTGMIIIIMGNEMTVDPALCLAVRMGALML